jgi:hypothetical protein
MKSLASVERRAELIRRLRVMRPDFGARWGRMTAHQMMCHLADAFRMAAGDKRVSSGGSRLPAGLMKFVALYLPLPWPRGIMTSPEIDQLCEGTTPGSFDADVAEVEMLLQTIAASATDAEWPRHPVFGRMSHAEWMRWAYLHTDHHLKQFGV